MTPSISRPPTAMYLLLRSIENGAEWIAQIGGQKVLVSCSTEAYDHISTSTMRIPTRRWSDIYITIQKVARCRIFVGACFPGFLENQA
jgi:hypothetical protein